MQLTAVFPTTEIGSDPGAVRAWATGVEELGFDRIMAYDHVLGAVHAGREPALWGPYTELDPFHEPLVLFGFLAAITTRVELMTGVLVLPQRPVALAAKQAIEVDLLSNGRLVLGVGTGWNFVEYESLGTEYRTRAKRLDEQIEVLRRLWSEPVVDFEGRWHRIDRAGLLPRSARPLPLWFGGSQEGALRRAARHGEGFSFGTAGARILTARARLVELLVEQGRDPATFPTEAILHAGKGPEVLATEAADWIAAGGTHLAVSTMTSTMLGSTTRPCDGVDAHLSLLAETRDLVRSLVEAHPAG
jgi:probable F420-dependent oxidoreductase